MRPLITGGGGQVGRALSDACRARRIKATVLARGKLDVTDVESVRAVVRTAVAAGTADVCINAAAYTDVDRAESEGERAFAVNRDGAAHMATACAEADIPLVHLSTDYVFSGDSTVPYGEDDPVGPINVYGESKWAGEEAVRATLPKHLIVRTSWVYDATAKNFVTTMLRLGREREVVRVVADQSGSPTSARDVGAAVLALAERAAGGGACVWGTYHYCNEGITSWHAFAKAIFSLAARFEELRVQRIEKLTTAEYPTSARRPLHSSLACDHIAEQFGIRARPWREALAEVIEEACE